MSNRSPGVILNVVGVQVAGAVFLEEWLKLMPYIPLNFWIFGQ
jgi:hypothetical protein